MGSNGAGVGSHGERDGRGGEPSTAPLPGRWYDIRLGPTFKDPPPSSKFCSLRYEFKPASVDKSQSGSLHKSKDNRVTVEFQSNQPGKRKANFEGISEDYKDNDAVLFFDGETFRLERLHRAVKSLKHIRLPGESMANSTAGGSGVETHSPPLGKVMKPQPTTSSRPAVHAVPVEIERIDIGEPDVPGSKFSSGKSGQHPSGIGNPSRPDSKSYELVENLDVLEEDEGIAGDTPNKTSMQLAMSRIFDINLPGQIDTDDEIADVDINDDLDEGPNAAEALRAMANTEDVQPERQETSSSSSGSSSSSSRSESGSGSGSTSSDSEGSDSESANSGAGAGDVEVDI